MARVIAVCISEKKGTMKKEVPEIKVKKERRFFHLCSFFMREKFT